MKSYLVLRSTSGGTVGKGDPPPTGESKKDPPAPTGVSKIIGANEGCWGDVPSWGFWGCSALDKTNEFGAGELGPKLASNGLNVDDTTGGGTLAGVDDGKLNGDELSTGKNVDSSSLLVVVVVVVVVAKMKQKKIVYFVFLFLVHAHFTKQGVLNTLSRGG